MISYIILGLLVFNVLLITAFWRKNKPLNFFSGGDKIESLLETLPNRVLQSITSSGNQLKGSLGELVTLLKLQANYDRLIPLNNIVDYIGISLPKADQEGYMHFIDCKTGKAKLSHDQYLLKQIIEKQQIKFIKASVKLDILQKENINEHNDA